MTALGHGATIPYALYITSAILTLFLMEGYLSHSDAPGNFQFQLDIIFVKLSIFSLYLFQRAFLAEQNVAARYRSLLIAVSIIPIIMTCFQLLFPRTFDDLASIIWGLLFALSPITGVMAIQRKLKGGIALLLGSIAVSVSVIGFTAMSLLSSQYTDIKSMLMLRAALVFEVIMFSLALFSQVRGMRMDGNRSCLTGRDQGDSR